MSASETWPRPSVHAGLPRDRTASADAADDGVDRSTTDSRVVPVFKESGVGRAVGRLLNAVCRETCEPLLRCGPTRQLSNVGCQNEERLPTEIRKSLVLTKDGAQLRELVTIGTQLTGRGTERAQRAPGIGWEGTEADERVDACGACTRERRK